MTHLLFSIHRRDGHSLANEHIVTLTASSDTLQFARQLLVAYKREAAILALILSSFSAFWLKTRKMA